MRTPRKLSALAAVCAAAALVISAGTATAVANRGPITSYGINAKAQLNESVVRSYVDQVYNRGNLTVLDALVSSRFTQHDKAIAEGKAALRDHVAALRSTNPQLHVDVKRVLAEGDLVLVHSNVRPTPDVLGTAVLDIYRVERGRIVEHWNTTQDMPTTSVSGNDMFSTVSSPQTAEPDRRTSTEQSKNLVLTFFTEALVNGDMTAFDRYVGGTYYQHNPRFPNGTEAVKAAFGPLHALFPDANVEVKRVVAEGDLVALHVLYQWNTAERGLAAIDIFRVRDGKIVEHWDVVEPVPATTVSGNPIL